MIADNTESINMPVLPLGMACVARAAEEAGHEVATLNLMRAKDLQQALVPLLASFRPHVIGLSIRNIDDQVSQGTRFFLEPVEHAGDFKPVVHGCIGQILQFHRPPQASTRFAKHGDQAGIVFGEPCSACIDHLIRTVYIPYLGVRDDDLAWRAPGYRPGHLLLRLYP
jgi:hypothetical protein